MSCRVVFRFCTVDVTCAFSVSSIVLIASCCSSSLRLTCSIQAAVSSVAAVVVAVAFCWIIVSRRVEAASRPCQISASVLLTDLAGSLDFRLRSTLLSVMRLSMSSCSSQCFRLTRKLVACSGVMLSSDPVFLALFAWLGPDGLTIVGNCFVF